MNLDVRHLLRIPEDIDIPREAEDEFECLNLEITCPPLGEGGGSLPVVIWIHGTFINLILDTGHAGMLIIPGGSQVVTFCSAASGICGMD